MNDLIGSVAIAVERRSWPALQPLFHRLAALPADTISVAGTCEFDSLCAAVKALPASEDADATRACADLIKVAQRALDAKHNASIPAVLSNSLYNLATSITDVSKRPFACLSQRSRDCLALQRSLWSFQLAVLNACVPPATSNPDPVEAAPAGLHPMLRAAVENFLACSLSPVPECESFVYPSYITTDPRLLDIHARLVSKLADTDCSQDSEAAVTHSAWRDSTVTALIKTMAHSSADLRLQALLAIGNLLAGSDAQTDQVLSRGFLAAVRPLVHDASLAVKKEAYWSLSNITAGSTANIGDVIQAQLLRAAIHALGNFTAAAATSGDGSVPSGERQDVRSECAWCVCNALCGANPAQRQVMIDSGALQACVAFLRESSGNQRVSLVVVNGIDSALKHLFERTQCSDNVGSEAALQARLCLRAAVPHVRSALRVLLRARSRSELYRKVVNMLRSTLSELNDVDSCDDDLDLMPLHPLVLDAQIRLKRSWCARHSEAHRRLCTAQHKIAWQTQLSELLNGAEAAASLAPLWPPLDSAVAGWLDVGSGAGIDASLEAMTEAHGISSRQLHI